jgi:transcriptional regulator GlxA family with amidase domain
MAPIHFGILMIPYQTLDVAGPTDILNSISKPYVESFIKGGFFAEHYPNKSEDEAYKSLPDRALDVEFHHIGETMDPVSLTSGFRVLPSTTCDECPELDYLLVGGPDVTVYHLPPKFATFIQNHVAKGKGIFTTCTGAFIVAESGVLDGRKATVNHTILDFAREAHPKVEWLKEQWVVDGEGGQFWTAGGACAGMDMFSQWVRERYDVDVYRAGLEVLDYAPRGKDGKLVVV